VDTLPSHNLTLTPQCRYLAATVTWIVWMPLAMMAYM
jgi:hypothetical protein